MGVFCLVLGAADNAAIIARLARQMSNKIKIDIISDTV